MCLTYRCKQGCTRLVLSEGGDEYKRQGKSTEVRGLAALLPSMTVVKDCAYGCDPKAMASLCAICSSGAKTKVKTELRPVPVVDLPLGATEDRVLGALDIEKALTLGEKAFEPGLLAKANRGFLYID